jgi:caffeoyl-CoA O-methyltransferase
MSKFLALTEPVYRYVVAHKSENDEVLAALAEETAKLGPIGVMQIAPEQGAFMSLLTRVIGAKSAVEVGTFTGYSAISVARALPEDGKLLACDVSEEWRAIARRYFERAQVSHKIDLRIGPAIDTLRALPKTPQFDIGFVDADKKSYLAYYEEILLRLRPNGLLLIDNTLWQGAVADPAVDDEQTQALRALNDHLAHDSRVEVVLLPIADGLTIVRKKDSTELG